MPMKLQKYISIILLLVFGAAGGILSYHYLAISKRETTKQGLKTSEQEIEAKKQELKTSEQKIKETQIKTEKEAPKDETADWKVYRNEEFGFEMKYPPKWEYNKVEKNYIGFYDPEKVKIPETPYELIIKIFHKEKGIPLDRWVQEEPEMKMAIKNELEIGEGKVPEGSFRNINNLSFYLIKTSDFMGGSAIANAYVEKNGLVIKLSRHLLFPDAEKIFNRILSTFQFIE
jgi:hypothetical protein